MRDEIRYPNKAIWVVVGLVAFLCALSMVLRPADRREPTPPYDLRLFVVSPPQGFSIGEALEVIKRDPDNIALLLQIQHYYAYQGEWEEVVEIGKKIVSSPQGDREGTAYLGLVYAFIYLGQPQTAQEWIAKGLRKVEDKQLRAQLYRALGDVFLLQYEARRSHYDLSMAAIEYQLALQEWHEYAFARANLAYVRFRQGSILSARQLIREVLQSSASTPRDKAAATYYLAQIEEVSGNVAEAKRLYNQAREIHPESFIQ